MGADLIRPEVLAEWLSYNEPFEGRVHFMYLDRRGLVTTGVGNLIDPVAAALHLPWKRPDGTPATLGEVQEAWIAVKERTDLCLRGGGAYADVTTLRLDDSAVDALVFTRLREMATVLQHLHPCFAGLPADAQLATLSIAWAVGAAAHYPRMWAALQAGDYETAARESEVTPKVGTIIARNAANAARLRACIRSS